MTIQYNSYVSGGGDRHRVRCHAWHHPCWEPAQVAQYECQGRCAPVAIPVPTGPAGDAHRAEAVSSLQQELLSSLPAHLALSLIPAPLLLPTPWEGGAVPSAAGQPPPGAAPATAALAPAQKGAAGNDLEDARQAGELAVGGMAVVGSEGASMPEPQPMQVDVGGLAGQQTGPAAAMAQPWEGQEAGREVQAQGQESLVRQQVTAYAQEATWKRILLKGSEAAQLGSHNQQLLQQEVEMEVEEPPEDQDLGKAEGGTGAAAMGSARKGMVAKVGGLLCLVLLMVSCHAVHAVLSRACHAGRLCLPQAS